MRFTWWKKLRLGELPEAWIAPLAVRELRELVRYRAKAVRLRSGLKAQVYALMGKGILPTRFEMFGPGGQVTLDSMELAQNYRMRVESLRDLIEVHDREVSMLERKIPPTAQRRNRLPGHRGDTRGGPHPGGDLRGGDRRREPVFLGPEAMLVDARQRLQLPLA